MNFIVQQHAVAIQVAQIQRSKVEIFDLVLSFTSSLAKDGVDDSHESHEEGINFTLLKDLQSLGPNVIFMRDAFGNTVLHLCVIHGLQEMYRHVYRTAEVILKREIKLLYAQTIAPNKSKGPFELQDLRILEKHDGICMGYNFIPKKLKKPQADKFEEWINYEARIKVEERLVLALNMDYHSPLTLAAARMSGTDNPDVAARKVEMFKFLLDMHKKVLYEYGIVNFTEIGLLGLEIEYDYKHYDIPASQRHNIRSAIDWMCIRGAEQAMVIPDILAFCRNTSKYLRISGVPVFHVICKSLNIVSFGLFCLFRFSQQANYVAVKFFLAITLLASWISIYYYLMAFESTGPFMLTLARIVGMEIPNFLKFYVIVIVAFSCGLTLLADNGDCGSFFGFSSMFKTIWVLVQDTLHPEIPASLDISSIDNVNQSLQWANNLLITAYYGSVNIVMLNILIAIINATYSFYTAFNDVSNTFNNEAVLLIAKYNILQYMECFDRESAADHRRRHYCIVETLDRDFSPFDATEGGRMSLKDFSSHKDHSVASQYTEYLFEMQEETDYWAQVEENDVKRKAQNVTVLIICPQMDFLRGGAFPIDGANEDCKRTAAMIRTNVTLIHNIIVILESRYEYNISHSLFWLGKNGLPPKPFTTISYLDIMKKVWLPRDNSIEVVNWCLAYTKALEQRCNRVLTIWPDHCIIGSRGHAVDSAINEALQEWAVHSHRPVVYVTKGQNWKTEMLSALEAEIVDPLDYSTALNSELLSILRMSDKLIVCGQALSHAVNFTMRDLMKHWRGDMSQIVFLEDGSLYQDCFRLPRDQQYLNIVKELMEDLKLEGVTIATTNTAFPIYFEDTHAKRKLKRAATMNSLDLDGESIHAVGCALLTKELSPSEQNIEQIAVFGLKELALRGYSDKLVDSLEGDFTPSEMPYTGLTILHLVILRKDYDEVRWLLDFYKDHKYSVEHGLEKLLAANVTGSFFSSSGEFYFGGYPLQFAVCSNSIEIFDLVLSYASSIDPPAAVTDGEHTAPSETSSSNELLSLGPNVIFMRDSVGNTVVHLCAIHGLKAMFQHFFIFVLLGFSCSIAMVSNSGSPDPVFGFVRLLEATVGLIQKTVNIAPFEIYPARVIGLDDIADGKHPDPFTVIRYVDIKNGVWRPQEDTAEMMDWCLEYVKALERKGRMKLTIWPQHCIIGSKGHCIVPAINEALQEWAAYSHRPMYSALEAEVVDPLDQSTALNNEVLSLLRVADRAHLVWLVSLKKPDSNDGVAFSLSLYGRLKVMLGEMVLKRLNSANSGKARDFSDEISGDLTALKEKIAEDPTLDIGEHDAAGANIVHLAYLYEFYHIGHWLVESYPDLALKPYSDNVPEEFADMGFTEGMMPYTGENILHIVIVRRNYKEVRWLLDFFKDHKDSVPYGLAKLLMSNANGNFFDPSGEFYFGGYPLQFAVCSNSQEIFDLVLSFASSVEADQVRSEEVEDRQTEGGTPLVLGPSVIFMRDSYGNTMLHLCVIHGLTDMFEHVLSIASTILKRDIQLSYSNKASEEVHNTDTFYLPEIEHASGYNLPESSLRLPEPDRYETWVLSEARQKIDERLLLVLNNHKLSPLTLAASLSNKVTSTVSKERRSQMMKTVMVSTNTKILLWRYGPIACHDVNLKGVDIDYDLSEYESFVETTSNTENLSAINWLCINEDTDLIQMSEIKAIIDRKWERYGLPLFVLDCLLDGVITTLMTLIAIFVDVSFTVRPHFGFECISSVLEELQLLIEASSRDWRNTLILRSVSGDRKLSHVYPTYWDETPTSFPTGSNTPTSYPTSIPSFQYNPQDYPGSKITLSICVVTCWFNLYYYMMGFKKTGPFMLTFKRVVVHDLPYFLQFFFIPLIGFALCISMLENDGTVEKNYAFWNTARTVWALIQKAVTVNVFIDTTDLTLVPNNLQWLSNLLLTTFYFFEVLIMLNLLIAIINDTYALWSSCDESIFLIEKCNIMDFFDKQLGAEQLMIQREKFCNVKTLKKEMSRSSHSLDIRGSEQSNTTQIFTMEMMEIEPEWCAVISDTTMNSRLQKTSLFIIDPQVDFHPGGSLAVPGANEDSERIAAMIKKNKHFIHEIFVSMDSHYPNHIAHAVFWINKEGKHPEPFTEIRYADVKDGALERKGRVKLIIWPQHCIIGSKGHCIVPVINDALQEWAAHSHRPVTYIMKGQNCRTEMYSALEAEVVDPLDHTTALNSDLLSMLRVAEREGVLVSTTLAAFEDKALFPSKVVETNSDDDDDQSLPDQAEVVSFDESEMGGPEMKSSSEEKEEHHQQVAKIERKDVVFGDEANEEIHAYILGEAENETPRTSAMSWLSLQNKFGDFLLKSLNITHNYSYKKFLDTLSSMNVSIHNDKQKLFYYIEMGDLHNLKEQLQLCFRDCTTAVERKRFLKRYVDAVGANIVHLAYLIENYDLAHWLVETFPEVALEPYSDQLPKFIGEEFEGFEMPYSGENILHMVIVRRNYVEVRWLLDFYKDHKDSVPNGLKTLLVANATGKFFDISGEFYFGGYPLQFAVCSNSIDIFDLVLSFASSLEVDSGEDQLEEDGASTLLGADVPSLGPNVIFMRDTNGNTVLHLCVMHGLQDMFEHVYKVAETIISREIKLVYSQLYDTDGDQHVALESFEETSAITTGYGLKPKMLKIPSDEKKYDEWVKAETFAKLQERLLLVLNHDLHSPLTLAAVIKETDSASKKARKLSMLTYLLKKLKTTLWTFGKEQCAEVALEGLEVKYDLSDYVIPAGRQLPRYHSVLSWLCIHDVEPAIMIPEIRRIIETKWERCGLPCYIKSFVLDFVIVILLSLVLLYGNYTPTRSTEFAIYWFVNIIYALIIAIFAVLVFTELFHIIRFRKIFRHVRGIAQFHIACRSAEMLSFTVFCISKFARMQSGQITRCNYGDTELHTEDFVDIKIPLIICVMTSWIHLYYYLMGFQRTGLFVLTLSRIIARDVPHFLRFFVICLFAFACAISLLGNTGNYHTHFAFWRFLKTIWSLIQEAVNLPTIDDQTLLTLVPIDLQWLSDIWNTLFYYTGAYVM
eukprot:gene18101-18340_t